MTDEREKTQEGDDMTSTTDPEAVEGAEELPEDVRDGDASEGDA